ncbi:hypothetical protein CEXT_706231 [Caerostris extrusa]|uniref:Uncharacterized protein n=1 Tax=Caerostris extrusa TaxID=172846 RepID=A0AAV4XD42_CAEEX|nr:hypothetical protein CEXT_706231 [Caerostris extrusa]
MLKFPQRKHGRTTSDPKSAAIIFALKSYYFWQKFCRSPLISILIALFPEPEGRRVFIFSTRRTPLKENGTDSRTFYKTEVPGTTRFGGEITKCHLLKRKRGKGEDLVAKKKKKLSVFLPENRCISVPVNTFLCLLEHIGEEGNGVLKVYDAIK